jgi:GalNAc5-diNAcBac-PP-undecaprenol beta-1,3-glucosyltransferase
MKPLISIIIPTYNRAGTLKRTVDSILGQSWQDFEIVIVDDGSTDHTAEVLNGFRDERIKTVKHPVNKGVTAAKNTGLDTISGEWFTVVDSDDELVPDALEQVISVPLNLDPSVNKITCNGYDSVTKEFTGTGIDHDQYIDEKTIISELHGDFWGLTKTSLLGNDRFLENLLGVEDSLWLKIYEKARIYYIHKALLIVHTEGTDRVSNKRKDIHAQALFYKELKNDSFYLQKIRKYNPAYYIKICTSAVFFLSCDKNKNVAGYYARELKQLNRRKYLASVMMIVTPAMLLTWLYNRMYR